MAQQPTNPAGPDTGGQTHAGTARVFSRRWGFGQVTRFLHLAPTRVVSGGQLAVGCRLSIQISTVKLLREGQIIRQTYEVEKLLGGGAFAEVYRVKHRFLGRQAMKVFKTAGMSREDAEKMLSEAIILSRIGHPNIVRVFDADLVETSGGECAFFTMEYVAGGTLQDFWKSHGASFVPVETAVEILRQVCRGLAVAHEEKPPIIHRDIKPQNILVGYDASGLRARLTDFGLAKRVNPLTLLASARGTLRFKSPEVFQDPGSDSCAGDPTREVAHDDVAEQALRCQVAYAKKTQQWRRSVQLLERAAPLAASASVLKTLRDNLAIVRGNAGTGNDFCGDGYHDLPPAHLDQMEQARERAEGGDFEQAVAILEALPRPDLMACPRCGRALQWSRALAGQAPCCARCKEIFPVAETPELFPAERLPLLDKALAYCLCGRGVQRVNRAGQGADELLPTLKKALVRLRLGVNLAHGLGEATCAACGEFLGPQFYTITLRGTRLQVCLGCHARIQAEDQARKKRLQEAVRLAAQDLVRAGQLDPANKFVQKQIQQVREVCANIGVALPKPPKGRKPALARPATGAEAGAEPAPAPAGKVCAAANWSLGLALVGLWPCGLLGALPAVICGHVALRDIARSGGALAGRGRAELGLVVGYLGLVIHLIALLAKLAGK